MQWFQSTEQSERTFCATCGTSMFFRSVLSPGEIHIPRALFLCEVDQAPTAHVFAEYHVPWLDIHDELSQLTGTHSGLEKYKDVKPLE